MSSPINEAPPPSRLSIAHLMLWTLGSAIMLSCFRALDSGESDEQQSITSVMNVIGAVLILGAQMGGILLFLGRRICGIGGFPTQPGHWLLVIGGLAITLSILEELACWSWQNAEFSWLIQIPTFVAVALAAAAAWARLRWGRLWSLAFLLLVIQHALVALLAALDLIPLLWRSAPELPRGLWDHGLFYALKSSLFPPAVGLAVLLAAALDRRRSESDFLHWTGVGTMAATSWLNFSPIALQNLFA